MSQAIHSGSRVWLMDGPYASLVEGRVTEREGNTVLVEWPDVPSGTRYTAQHRVDDLHTQNDLVDQAERSPLAETSWEIGLLLTADMEWTPAIARWFLTLGLDTHGITYTRTEDGGAHVPVFGGGHVTVHDCDTGGWHVAYEPEGGELTALYSSSGHAVTAVADTVNAVRAVRTFTEAGRNLSPARAIAHAALHDNFAYTSCGAEGSSEEYERAHEKYQEHTITVGVDEFDVLRRATSLPMDREYITPGGLQDLTATATDYYRGGSCEFISTPYGMVWRDLG